jgi:hypothetical protein
MDVEEAVDDTYPARIMRSSRFVWSMGARILSIASMMRSTSRSVSNRLACGVGRSTVVHDLEFLSVAIYGTDGLLHVLPTGLEPVERALDFLGETLHSLHVGKQDLDLSALLREASSPWPAHSACSSGAPGSSSTCGIAVRKVSRAGPGLRANAEVNDGSTNG